MTHHNRLTLTINVFAIPSRECLLISFCESCYTYTYIIDKRIKLFVHFSKDEASDALLACTCHLLMPLDHLAMIHRFGVMYTRVVSTVFILAVHQG